MKAVRIQVNGIVQGVGFRPFICRLATERGLSGYVVNSSHGVLIEAEGSEEAVDSLVRAIQAELPPQAVIDSLSVGEIEPSRHAGFRIRESQNGAGVTRISPDIAVCSDCLREMEDPSQRRHAYPFTNCTNCGPRLSIIRSTPYDRPATTMAEFEMCPQCRDEYRDPADRRFHAQPIACPACGPAVRLCDGRGRLISEKDRAMAGAAGYVARGGILAVKGLGGFHVCCDAANGRTVGALRERKARPQKPLALMADSIESLRQVCLLEPEEERLLASAQAPIVLCRKVGNPAVSELVSPGNRYLGVMLPYTPLHRLMFKELAALESRPWLLVMTSGNVHDLPIIADDREALEKLGGLADMFLLHDRGIENRNDDSIVMAVKHEEKKAPAIQIVRHSRGYAPNPVRLPKDCGPCLAVGGQMKNTFCLAEGGTAYLSQHIGEADSLETMSLFEEMEEKFRRWFKIEPEALIHDMHPDYLTTRWAKGRRGLGAVAVQHHSAHMLSVLADNMSLEPAIGIIFDGTGYGPDGRIWGGEFLYFDGERGIRRMAHLEYLPLPGGEASIHNPWRIAAAYTRRLLGRGAEPLFPDLDPRSLEAVDRQVEGGTNLAWTSSLGRLFDAASAAMGICHSISFEAQAAMALESRADAGEKGSYRFGIESGPGAFIIRLGNLWADMVDDIGRGAGPGICAARFQNTVVDFAMSMCDNIKFSTNCRTAALAGGVFQNRFLLERISRGLSERGFKVLINRQVPANDGGLALGQVLYHAINR